MSSAIPSAKYSCSGSLLILANGKTAMDGLSGRPGTRATSVGMALGAVSVGVGVKGTRYTPTAMFLRLCSPRSSKVGRACRRFGRGPCPTHKSRPAQRSPPTGRRHSPRALDVVTLDYDVAEFDADSEYDPLAFQGRDVALRHPTLH